MRGGGKWEQIASQIVSKSLSAKLQRSDRNGDVVPWFRADASALTGHWCLSSIDSSQRIGIQKMRSAKNS